MMKHVAVALLLFLILPLSSSSSDKFNLRLVLDFQSAEQTAGLYEGLSGWPEDIARLRGSRIAAATTGLLAGRRLDVGDVEAHLRAAKFGQTEGDDVFRMSEARANVRQIKELLTEIKRRNFAQRVVLTVQQLFPVDAGLSATLPIFFVAFGHQNIDAFVRNVVWYGDTPTFVGEGEGVQTTVVNLAKAVRYGRTLDERFIGTLSVVAHEVFHAAFGEYKRNSPVWQEYYATYSTYLDHLLDLTHNEGIAHYLTFEQRTGGRLPTDWQQKVTAAFREFNRNAELLTSPTLPPRRAGEIIRASNTSGYWESYGAITGLFIAREIDRVLGRPALARTIAEGPNAFYRIYEELRRRDAGLPELAEVIRR